MFFFRPIIFKKITVHKNLRGRSVSGRDGFVLKTTPTPSDGLTSDCENIP
ncbi:hypothetical protein EC2735000_2349 [Escherichia coli 2735000]|nr:hypothetical protein EC2735000_2349 [Escherichia coli 2735000]